MNCCARTKYSNKQKHRSKYLKDVLHSIDTKRSTQLSLNGNVSINSNEKYVLITEISKNSA